MDRMNYPRGLIRFTTQNAEAKGWGRAEILRHVVRPRVLVYTTVLLTLTVVVLTSLVVRTPFKVDVVRDRAALSRIVAGGKLENVYRLQIMNATEQPQRYRISATGPGGAGDRVRGRGHRRAGRIALGGGEAADPVRQRAAGLAPDPFHHRGGTGR